MKKKIGIIGCGWLGSRVGKHLIPRYSIFATTTSLLKIQELNLAGFSSYSLNLTDKSPTDKTQYEKIKKIFSETEVIIISVPFSKKSIFKELENKIRNLLSFIHEYKGKIIFFSSIGIYPDCDKQITEDSIDSKYFNQNLFFAEKSLQEAFPEIVILRLGGLMEDTRIFSNFFINKPISSPNQRVNHVHYSDICGIIEKILDLDIRGKTYNITTPLHPKKTEFFSSITNSENLQKIRDNTDEGKIISSEKVKEELNYEFIFPDPLHFA